jgi:hypothetical protein
MNETTHKSLQPDQKGIFRNSPKNATQMMKSIYGKDCTGINPQVPGKRFKLITHLFMQMQKSRIDQNVATEVLKRIQARMNDVPKTRSGPGQERHVRLSPGRNFAEKDFGTIAANFEITASDAQEIMQLYQGCFDGQDNFLRSAFERNVSRFARHEKKVFEILWEFLKETPQRSNRLPFLNSLQLLVAETKKPIQAIKVLLADFIQNPASVHYSDRNAMMLINQLLRDYNKEAIKDIEITPEEVLLVKGGLDESVVNYVTWKVDSKQKTFLKKMDAIRKRLVEALNPDISKEQLLPVRFLMALEREAYIFLALVGGKTAVKAMQSALKVYGNPASQIYHLKESPGQREALLSHLVAIVRGFGRLGRRSDMSLLDAVRIRQDQFMGLHPDMHYQTRVRRMMGLIDASKVAISSRSN